MLSSIRLHTIMISSPHRWLTICPFLCSEPIVFLLVPTISYIFFYLLHSLLYSVDTTFSVTPITHKQMCLVNMLSIPSHKIIKHSPWKILLLALNTSFPKNIPIVFYTNSRVLLLSGLTPHFEQNTQHFSRPKNVFTLLYTSPVIETNYLPLQSPVNCFLNAPNFFRPYSNPPRGNIPCYISPMLLLYPQWSIQLKPFLPNGTPSLLKTKFCLVPHLSTCFFFPLRKPICFNA